MEKANKIKLTRKDEIRLECLMNLETGIYNLKPISYDSWEDFGYWLEAISFMADIVRNEKRMTKEQMAEYIEDYVLGAMSDGFELTNNPATKNKS